jgi:hypothetical protein
MVPKSFEAKQHKIRSKGQITVGFCYLVAYFTPVLFF